MLGKQISQQLLVSGLLIALTTFIHVIVVVVAAGVIRSVSGYAHGGVRFLRDIIVLVALVLWLMLAHGLEIALWGGAFLKLGVFQDTGAALYFAAASYTTLGSSDVLAPEAWRLLSGAAAANGFLLFGLSAAFLFDAASKFRLADA